MDTRFRIVPGAGQPIDVDVDAVRRQQGTVSQVLHTIITEQVRAPELLTLLDDPATALEMFSIDADGRGHEAVLGRTDDWSQIIQRLERSTVEVGLAKRMTMGGRNRRGSGNRRSRAHHHAPRQRFVALDEHYELTPADLEEVDAGRKSIQVVDWLGGDLHFGLWTFGGHFATAFRINASPSIASNECISTKLSRAATRRRSGSVPAASRILASADGLADTTVRSPTASSHGGAEIALSQNHTASATATVYTGIR